MPGGVPYIHRCFVVFRNALITFYEGATAVAEGARVVAAAAAVAVALVPAVVPSGEPRLVRFSWLFHSRPETP